jgi:hypothetical protein
MKQKLEKLEEQFSTESEVSKNNSLNCAYGRMYSAMLWNLVCFNVLIHSSTFIPYICTYVLQLSSIINKPKLKSFKWCLISSQ